MNTAMVRYLLGCVAGIEGIFFLVPCLTSLVYRESTAHAYFLPALLCFLTGFLFARKKPHNSRFYAREGFVSVTLCWFMLALFGTLPYLISGEIPNFLDALFESVSGFTATGSSVVHDVEALSHATLLWRSMTHWIGGMGVLVFLLAILPLAGGHSMHLMRAESAGPSVTKLAPHLRDSAKYLYLIYIALTILQAFFLLLGQMPFFDAINISLSTAGTGGFSIWNNSLAHYDTLYPQIITCIFMILFGINFSMYFLILTKRWKQAFRNEELRFYLGLIGVSTIVLMINLRPIFGKIYENFHHSFFQVVSIITTSSFSTIDYDQWPAFSKGILLILMFIGSCSGSTGGGIKCSRVILMAKSVKKELQLLIHPRAVRVHQMNGQKVPHETLRSINIYLIVFLFVFGASFLILSTCSEDLSTNFTSVLAAISNVGTGFGSVGPTDNYAMMPALAKIVLMFDMFAGRLEFFPMLLLFSPSTWRRNR